MYVYPTVTFLSTSDSSRTVIHVSLFIGRFFKSQNWPARTFISKKKIVFFKEFSLGKKKTSTPCTLFRICRLTWIDLFMKFSLRQEWSDQSVLTDGKHPKSLLMLS